METNKIYRQMMDLFYAIPPDERPEILADLYYRLDDGGKDEFLRETENE